MAVGKGSMARASKAAAAKKTRAKAEVIGNVEEAVVESLAIESTEKTKEGSVMAESGEKVRDVVASEAVEKAEEIPAIKKISKKTTSKKTTSKKTTSKKEVKNEVVGETKEGSSAKISAVVEATSEQVMQQIVYQKSFQVLDREPEPNETFGVGEAMPIYMF